MIVMVSHEVGTAPDFQPIEVIPVLVRRGENERFTCGLVLDGDDCGNHVGFGVDPIGGEAPDSLEEELLVRSFLDELAVAGADELELIVVVCHAGIVS